MKKQSIYLFTALCFVISLWPVTSLMAQSTVLYGMTRDGGINGKGVIIEYNLSTSTETVVWNFGSGTDGAYPYGDLVYNSNNGLFYGMTPQGGSYNNGSIFTFDPTTYAESVVWSFQGGTADGGLPLGHLLLHANGLYYGMTSGGGSYSKGAIFSFDPSTNKDSLLWSFGGIGDGAGPQGSLVHGPNGLFYGMTMNGGSYTRCSGGCGTIISFDPTTNAEQVVWNFGPSGDGTNPVADLTYDQGTGLFYGMTPKGGGNGTNRGCLFSFNPATNTENPTIFSFGYLNQACCPNGSLYNAGNGYFYGTAAGGGVLHGGGAIIYYYPSTGHFGEVYDFGQNAADGKYPDGNLVYDASSGLFYGMTNQGGSYNKGTIFSYSGLTTNTEVVLHHFSGGTDGEYPWGGFVLYTGCTGTAVDPISGPNTVCTGGNINLTDSTAGGTWSSEDTTIATVNNSGIVTGISTGAATIDYSVTLGCGTITVGYPVTVNSIPIAIITPSGSTTLCQGDSIVLTASAGASYLWSNSATTQNIHVSQTGNYTVIVTDANNCSASSAVTAVTVYQPGASQFSHSTCAGETYSFNNQNLNTSGAYYDTLQTIHGCDSIVTLNLTVNNALQTSISDTTCKGIAYQFNGHGLLQSGVYRDTMQSVSTGCDSIVSLSLLVDSVVLPTISRNGDTLQTQAFASYQWLRNGANINGASTRTIAIIQNGNYSVVVTNANGCSDTSASFNVTAVGIEEIASGYVVKLYPNPSTGSFTLVFSDNVVRDVEITDAVGRTVIESSKVARQENFNLEQLSAGVYIVRINQQGQVQRLKFTLVR